MTLSPHLRRAWSKTVGHLVDLPIRPLSSRAVAPGHMAEILFFTGVRYYRMDDAIAAPQPCAARRPRSAKRPKAPAVELQA